jgi:2-oxoisovalerate dehydrogenase E1 component beta subunit
VTEKNLVQTVHDTLWEEMKGDDRVVVLGEDVGARGGVFRVTADFLQEFGDQRVIDTPLAESGIIGVAIGMALHGLLPVAEIQFADFIHPAFDQIVSEAARIRYRSNGDFGVPLVIRAPWGGGVHGALYHSQSIEAFYGHVPGLKVVVPSTPYDVKGMLRAALRDPDPVLFLEHKKTYRLIKGEVPDEDYEVPIGPADVKREGTDLTCIAYGLMLHQSLEAAAKLQEEDGVSVEVVDVRTIAPLDRKTILRRRRGDHRHDRRGDDVRPRRSPDSHRRSRHPRDALRRPARALLHAGRGQDPRCNERPRRLLGAARASDSFHCKTRTDTDHQRRADSDDGSSPVSRSTLLIR